MFHFFPILLTFTQTLLDFIKSIYMIVIAGFIINSVFLEVLNNSPVLFINIGVTIMLGSILCLNLASLLLSSC